MAEEIERKFRVRSDGWRAAATGSRHIRQGYLLVSDDMNLRVRILDDSDAVITIKVDSHSSMSRAEFEYEIPLEDARQLIVFAGEHVVTKRRYDVPAGGSDWVVDVYEDAHAGLVVAEIELDRESESFARPDWLGDEVTNDPHFGNVELALHHG
jgi:adenylate cyclase